VTGSLRSPDDRQREALRRAVAAWAGPGEVAAEDVELVDVDLVDDGRPGVVDVLARLPGEADDRLAHAILGLRRPGDEVHVVGSCDDPVLGLLDDEHGMAVVVDGLHDAEVAERLLVAVGGPHDAGPVIVEREAVAPRGPTLTVSVAEDQRDPVLTFGDRCALRVFRRPRPGPHPGVALLLALDRVGFNHLPAPLAVWRRGGTDLGVITERDVGAASGWAVALASLRDLCACGGEPEEAGGDFAPEARALGTMVGRLHLALDTAYGRRAELVATWAADVAGTAALEGDAAAALEALGSSEARAPAIRLHGDLHLGRTARTDHGWILADTTPGVERHGSPLADVADVLWSLHHAAATTAAELGRDPLGHPQAVASCTAWEARNRRAFMAGYLSTPGVAGLVPPDRELVGRLTALFEAARDARVAARAEGW
jgi:maltokinase